MGLLEKISKWFFLLIFITNFKTSSDPLVSWCEQNKIFHDEEVNDKVWIFQQAFWFLWTFYRILFHSINAPLKRDVVHYLNMISNVQVTMDSRRRCRNCAQNIFGIVDPKIAKIMFSLAKNVSTSKRNLISNKKLHLASIM